MTMQRYFSQKKLFYWNTINCDSLGYAHNYAFAAVYIPGLDQICSFRVNNDRYIWSLYFLLVYFLNLYMCSG